MLKSLKTKAIVSVHVQTHDFVLTTCVISKLASSFFSSFIHQTASGSTCTCTWIMCPRGGCQSVIVVMQDPANKCPPLLPSASMHKRGAYLWDSRVHIQCCVCALNFIVYFVCTECNCIWPADDSTLKRTC